MGGEVTRAFLAIRGDATANVCYQHPIKNRNVGLTCQTCRWRVGKLSSRFYFGFALKVGGVDQKRKKKINEFNMNERQKLAWFHPNESINRI